MPPATPDQEPADPAVDTTVDPGVDTSAEVAADAAEQQDDTPSRIIAAAGRCFYRDGIYATGVDALAAEAGLSKRTLYNHFPSKDAVIAAYLRQREADWHERLADLWAECGDDPLERVIAYVRGYAQPLGDEVFRGSAFINAAAELADDEHEALAVIRESMDTMELGVRGVLAEAGVDGAEGLARTVLYLLEGGVAVGGARRDQSCLDDLERQLRAMVGPAVAAAHD